MLLPSDHFIVVLVFLPLSLLIFLSIILIYSVYVNNVEKGLKKTHSSNKSICSSDQTNGHFGLGSECIGAWIQDPFPYFCLRMIGFDASWVEDFCRLALADD